MADKIKIVMIDDEQDLCMVVKANLEDTGEFEVVTLSQSLEAENVVQREKPALILLDAVMPGRSGQDIVTSLKKNSATKGIPIIMVSGKGEMVFDKKKKEFKWLPNNPAVKTRGNLPMVKGAEALAQAYGVNDYVSKPFSTELLIQVIKDVLARTRKPEASSDEVGI